MFVLEKIKFKQILDIPYFSFRKNEINIVAGESGSGKTTLFKLLTKIYSQDSGEILFENENIKTLNSILHRRNAIFISQTSTLNGSLKDSIDECFWFQDKKPPNEQEIYKYMNSLELAKSMLEKDTLHFSAGEKQRASLLRGLMLNPKVLLLDEPFANLDYSLSYSIMDFLVNQFIKKQNKTILMISHFKELNEIYKKNVAKISNKNLEWIEE